jgi:hypothetical protein
VMCVNRGCQLMCNKQILKSLSSASSGMGSPIKEIRQYTSLDVSLRLLGRDPLKELVIILYSSSFEGDRNDGRGGIELGHDCVNFKASAERFGAPQL